MNYKFHYDELITKYGKKEKPEGYSERHHILPKSMGGTDEEDNLVYLTLREHVFAHHLLWRIHRNPSMAFAFTMMSRRAGKDPEEIRKAQSLINKGRKFSQERKDQLSLALIGHKKPAGFGKKLSDRLNNFHHLAKRVSIDGVLYQSSRKAAEALNISHRTVGRMVKRGDAFYLPPDEA